MLGKHKFRIGQRVRPSEYGIERNIFPGKKAFLSGTVIKVDRFNCPTVLWNGRKTTSGYHPDFIDPDRRRVKARILGQRTSRRNQAATGK